ncbi:uncharacterized protein M421DRAFT_418602 [Didymella exigua CBS 183.55]|uniref:Major facilitator superfamily (MFS) profile domain-containing protein n=1 Tax=Didymella exigua CBS 183.55 TaxID=1150837 RepID=A0A6A5RYF6_9PLEO|nr:uncharacterized protein M421DRAFT_418602 [Didymella exigua CBS 183.55]KAF1930287.1 hypothetical protein M421DRAFT_418602 [Didymella exigua CBS 183.55]
MTALTAAFAPPLLLLGLLQISMTLSDTAVMPSLLALAPDLTWQRRWIVSFAARPLMPLPATTLIADIVNQ